MTMRPSPAQTAQPKKTLASSAISTSPATIAVGATYARAMRGERPCNACSGPPAARQRCTTSAQAGNRVDASSAGAHRRAQRPRVASQFVAADFAHRLRRMPGINESARQRLARRNDGVGRDQRVRTDARAVHDHRRFADDDAVAERAGVHEAIAAHRDVVADGRAENLIGDVHRRMLAEPCIGADADVLAVGAHRRIVAQTTAATPIVERPMTAPRAGDVRAGAESRLVVQVVEDQALRHRRVRRCEDVRAPHCPTRSAAGNPARGSILSRDPMTAYRA